MTASTDFDSGFSRIMAEYAEDNPERRNLFQRLRDGREKRPVVLYGAGGNCEFAMYTCEICGIPVSCVCDGRKTGTYQYKTVQPPYRVITPRELLERHADAFVLITTWRHEREIAGQLGELGFPGEQILFTRNPFLLRPDEFIAKHLDGYRWAYDFFKDGHSRKKVLERIRVHILGEHVPADSQFFGGASYFGYPHWSLGRDEVFVDVGGYDGDSVQDFIRAAGEYSRIYFFEPDADNCARAERNLAGHANIDIVKKGVWSEETRLRFCPQTAATLKMGGCFAGSPGDGKNALPVTSLDVFFAGPGDRRPPTLIKMDIEGSERNALLGAAGIIRREKPKLAISIYHKPEDMYELPRLIAGLRDDYRTSLWQLGDGYWDLVLYAY